MCALTVQVVHVKQASTTTTHSRGPLRHHCLAGSGGWLVSCRIGRLNCQSQHCNSQIFNSIKNNTTILPITDVLVVATVVDAQDSSSQCSCSSCMARNSDRQAQSTAPSHFDYNSQCFVDRLSITPLPGQREVGSGCQVSYSTQHVCTSAGGM